MCLYKDKEYLYQQYIVCGRTQEDIAKEFNMNPKLLNYYIQKCNFGKKSKIKYSLNEDKIKITDPIFCYYAGLVATDGYRLKK